MSRFAAHGRKAADPRPERHRAGRRAAAAGAFALALGLIPAAASDAAAQSRSGIFINNDVLNSLGPGPEAAPAAPLAPAAPPTALSPRSSPTYQAPLVPPAAANGNLSFEPYGSGNFVMTRPGTLLFPPLQEPDSTLTPGFAGQDENEEARARALDNAFAEGPEPSSQLLIPLSPPAAAGAPDSGANDSVVVFMENLPPADPDADAASAPRLTLRPPPQPAPRKPAVPAEMVATLQTPEPVEAPAALAPEFAEPEITTPEPATMAALPEAPVEQVPLSAPEPAVAEPAVAEPAVAEPAAEPVAADPVAAEPVAAEPVAARQSAPEPTVEETPAPVLADSSATDAPVSLLPAAAETPGGVQTASLSVGMLEDRSLLFEVDSAELSPEAQTELRALAGALRGGVEGDIQVLGFASGQDGSEDQARKLALSRALKVRSFLIDEGIASARIRVRSLGDRAEDGPANRVDIRPIGS